MSTDDEQPIYPKILSRDFLPILLLIGNVGCFLSFFIFLKKSMRKTASGFYFFAFTLSNLIFINLTMIDTILFFGFHIDPTANSFRFCQFHFYIGFVTSALSSSCLVLASADRYVMTSSNDSIRRFSRRTMAKKLFVFVTLFWFVVHLHPFFLLIESNSIKQRFSCEIRSKIYTLIIVFYELIVFTFITPFLWIAFGIRTIENVRRVLVQPLSRLNAIDRQLILILFCQCSLFLLFRLPLPIAVIYTFFKSQSTDKLEHIETLFFYTTLVCFYVPFCTFFFVNFISKSFRDEFRRTMKSFFFNKNKFQRRVRQNRNIRIYPLKLVQ